MLSALISLLVLIFNNINKLLLKIITISTATIRRKNLRKLPILPDQTFPKPIKKLQDPKTSPQSKLSNRCNMNFLSHYHTNSLNSL